MPRIVCNNPDHASGILISYDLILTGALRAGVPIRSVCKQLPRTLPFERLLELRETH
jgi:hypothetical protein